MRLTRFIPIGICVLCMAMLCAGQTNNEQDSLSDRARAEYKSKQYAAAVHDWREIVKRNPSNIEAQIYLGQSLYGQKRYADSIKPFEKARQLEASGTRLPTDQHRDLIDSLTVAYGVNRNFENIYPLLDEEIRQDPDYPIYYYNLACAYAEEGNKRKMLENLLVAYQHRDHMPEGKPMPDPRADGSFRDYLLDGDFIRLMRHIGYN